MKTIYITGRAPMTGPDDILEYFEAEKFYRRLGFHVTSAYTLKTVLAMFHEYHGLPAPTEKEVADYCLETLVKEADVVAVIPDKNGAVPVTRETGTCIRFNISIIEAFTNRPVSLPFPNLPRRKKTPTFN
jgi:hypothetical protein